METEELTNSNTQKYKSSRRNSNYNEQHCPDPNIHCHYKKKHDFRRKLPT